MSKENKLPEFPKANQPDALRKGIEQKLGDLQVKTENTKERRKLTDALSNLPEASADILKNVNTLVEKAQEIIHNDKEGFEKIVDLIHARLVRGEKAVTTGNPEIDELSARFQDVSTKVTTVFEGLKKQLGTFGSGMLKMLEGIFGPNTALGKVFGALKESPEAKVVYLMKKKSPKQEIEGDPIEIVEALSGQVGTARDREEIAFPNKPTTYDFVTHLDAVMQTKEVRGATVLDANTLFTGGEAVLESHKAKLDAKVASLRASPSQPAAAPNATKVERKEQRVGETALHFEVTQAGAKMEASFKKDKAVFSKDAKNSHAVSQINSQNITAVTVVDATPAAPADIVFVLNDASKVTASAKEIFDAVQNADTTKKQIKGVTAGGGEIQFEITPYTV